MTQQSATTLLFHIIALFRASGLPEECLTEPIKWKGTRDQQEALHQLQTAIDDVLPKLPNQLPAQPFVYCPETDPDVKIAEMLVEIDDLRELAQTVAPEAIRVSTTAKGITITAATREREQKAFDLLKTRWDGVIGLAQDRSEQPQTHEGHNASHAEWKPSGANLPD